MKTNDTILRARVQKSFKTKSERVFAKLGLTTDVAINMFLARVSRDHALPFSVTLEPLDDNNDILAPAAHRQRVLESFYES